eukprot:16795-Pelagomonas_calceolata.AAC.5
MHHFCWTALLKRASKPLTPFLCDVPDKPVVRTFGRGIRRTYAPLVCQKQPLPEQATADSSEVDVAEAAAPSIHTHRMPGLSRRPESARDPSTGAFMEGRVHAWSQYSQQGGRQKLSTIRIGELHTHTCIRHVDLVNLNTHKALTPGPAAMMEERPPGAKAPPSPCYSLAVGRLN